MDFNGRENERETETDRDRETMTQRERERERIGGRDSGGSSMMNKSTRKTASGVQSLNLCSLCEKVVHEQLVTMRI